MVLALSMTWTHCEVYWDLDFEPSETSGGQPVKKYVNIPSEKYIYVHKYVYICVYTNLCKMDEYRSYNGLS